MDLSEIRVAIAGHLVKLEDLLGPDYLLTLVARHVKNPKANIMTSVDNMTLIRAALDSLERPDTIVTPGTRPIPSVVSGPSLIVKMPDGSEWTVPRQVIVDHRLSYYRGIKHAEPEDEDPPDEWLLDWAPNNMDWRDVKDHAVQVKPPQPSNYADGWVNAEMEVRR